MTARRFRRGRRSRTVNRTYVSDYNYGNLLAGSATVFTIADFFAGGLTGDSLMQNFPETHVKPFALYQLGFYGQDDWRLK